MTEKNYCNKLILTNQMIVHATDSNSPGITKAVEKEHLEQDKKGLIKVINLVKSGINLPLPYASLSRE